MGLTHEITISSWWTDCWLRLWIWNGKRSLEANGDVWDAPLFLPKLLRNYKLFQTYFPGTNLRCMDTCKSSALIPFSHPLLKVSTQAAVPWESIWEIHIHRWQSKALDPLNLTSWNVEAGEIFPTLWKVIVTLLAENRLKSSWIYDPQSPRVFKRRRKIQKKRTKAKQQAHCSSVPIGSGLVYKC